MVPEGIINLPLTVGEKPNRATVCVDFVVIKRQSPFNAIMGRPTLMALKAIMSMHHLALKFPTESGVGIVRGSQYEARNCYLESTRVGKSSD